MKLMNQEKGVQKWKSAPQMVGIGKHVGFFVCSVIAKLSSSLCTAHWVNDEDIEGAVKCSSPPLR